MENVLTIALALAAGVPVSSNAPRDDGMRLLAKEIPKMRVVVGDVGSALTKHGAKTDAVRKQVETAMRRCGFTIDPNAKIAAFLNVTRMSHNRSFSGDALLQVLIPTTVNGESVFIDPFTDGMIFAGPDNTAADELRIALAELLDKFCNFYTRARQEVRADAGK